MDPNREFKAYFTLLTLLAFLPVLVLGSLAAQRLRPRAENQARIEINPSYILTSPNAAPIQLSALLYDSNNQPVLEGVSYQWGMSSTSIGRLVPNDNLATFYPTTVGQDNIWVTANNAPLAATGSIPVQVCDGSTLSCAPTPAPVQFVIIDRPNGGEIIPSGSTFRILWKSSPDATNISLYYILNDSASDNGTLIVSRAPNLRFYDWTVPLLPSTPQAKIRIDAYGDNFGPLQDTSDNWFTIAAPPATPTPIVSPTPIPPTPTPTLAPVSVSLTPTDDSYVTKRKPQANYGQEPRLKVDGSPIETSYLKFILPLPPSPQYSLGSAHLRVKVAGNSSIFSQNIKAVADVPWTENTLTYHNRPALGSFLATIPAGPAETWKDLNLTPYVSTRLGQPVSLGLDSQNLDGIDFYSQESGPNSPQLIITFFPR